MSATLATHRPALSREQWSAVLVSALALLAVALGWAVKSASENATRPLTVGPVHAAAPEGWVVEEGAGDLLFTLRNRLERSQAYSVSLLPAGAASLEVIARRRSEARSQLVTQYRQLQATPIVAGGREGYKVAFAYTDAASAGMPAVIEGVDYTFPAGDQVLVISFAAQMEQFQAGLPQFQRFLASVNVQPGE